MTEINTNLGKKKELHLLLYHTSMVYAMASATIISIISLLLPLMKYFVKSTIRLLLWKTDTYG